MKGYDYELLATKTIYANPPADGSSYDYTLVFCHTSLLLKQNPVGEINIFIVYRRQYGNAICPRERGLQAQNTYKRRQISPFGVRKPVFFVEVRPFEATSEYTGCIP
uniref:DUF4377 domain-containing protein n=1 Tax=Prevotella sp. TaxID=59823 RepID=UPI004024E298